MYVEEFYISNTDIYKIQIYELHTSPIIILHNMLLNIKTIFHDSSHRSVLYSQINESK